MNLLTKRLITLQHYLHSFYVTHAYWCSTYFGKNRIPLDNKCPQCNNNNGLSSLPIMADESFAFDHDAKCGVELKFKSR